MPAWSLFEHFVTDLREGRLRGRGWTGFKERFLLWFHATDPGLIRFRLALQVMLAYAIGTLGGVLFLGALGQTARIGALAGVLAMNSTLPIQDLKPRPRLFFIGKLVLIASTSAVAAVVLRRWPLAGYAGFVGVMVYGAWMQRWGRRGMGMAGAAFMAYFYVMFLRAVPAQIPAVLIAVVMAYAGLLLVTFVLVRDQERTRARKLVRGFLARITQTAEAAGRAAEKGSLSDAQEVLVDGIVRVQEVALQIDSALDLPRAREGVSDPVRLRGHVLLAEHLTDHFNSVVLRALRTGDESTRERLASHLRTLDWKPIDSGDQAPSTAELFPPHTDDIGERITGLYRRLTAAMASVELAAREPEKGHTFQDPWPAREQAPGTPGPPATTGKMIQVALAGTLSIVIGSQLSETYWYWAAIGAFFIILTTQSRGASIRKALERIAGTAFGVLGGAGLASVLKGSSSIELGLIAVLVLVGFWFIRSSYLVMMLSFTAMIALLYDVMGVYSLQLLLVRLWETIIGAGLGGLAALLILPVSTRKTFDDHLARMLESVEGVLTSLNPRTEPVVPPSAIYDRLRDLDRTLTAARDAGRMLTTGFRKDVIRRARREIVLMASLRFRVRELVASTADDAGRIGPVCPEAVDALELVSRRTSLIRGQIHEPDKLVASTRYTRNEAEALEAAPGRTGETLRAIYEALDSFVESRMLAAGLANSQADE